MCIKMKKISIMILCLGFSLCNGLHAASLGETIAAAEAQEAAGLTTVKIFQVDPDGGGFLCHMEDRTLIYVQYHGNDVVDDETVTIKLERNGVHRYQSRGGAKSVARYRWVPVSGERSIHADESGNKERETLTIFQALTHDSGGMLCKREDGSIIFLEYPEDDVVDDETIEVSMVRIGTYTYETQVGSKTVARYRWIAEPGQYQIHMLRDARVETIAGRIIQITSSGITLLMNNGRACVLVGHPQEMDFVDDERIRCQAKRDGAHSFINRNNSRRTLPRYQYVGD